MTNESFFRITSSPNGEINGRRMGAVEVETQSHSAALKKWEIETFTASSDDRRGGSDSLFQTPATCELAWVERREPGRFAWQKNGWKKWEPDCIFLPPIFLPACRRRIRQNAGRAPSDFLFPKLARRSGASEALPKLANPRMGQMMMGRMMGELILPTLILPAGRVNGIIAKPQRK
jgi:hypothetical protein